MTVFGVFDFCSEQVDVERKDLKMLMISLKCGVEAAFLRMSKEPAREVSSISARLDYPLGMLSIERNFAIR